MERDEIIEKLRASLGKVLDTAPLEVGPASRLREDLGLDSFAALEMLFELEEMVGIKIPQAAVMELRTVEDVLTYIERVQRGELPAAPVRPPAPVKVTGA
jgi:acyl carrier protein